MAGPTKKQLEENLAEALEDRRTRTEQLLRIRGEVMEAWHWLAHHAGYGNRGRAIAYALGVLEGSQMRLPCPCQRKGGE